MTSYEEILESAKRLSSVERLQLADALLAEELGFGMWRGREDVADAGGLRVEVTRGKNRHD
jgi:hypothetical protein